MSKNNQIKNALDESNFKKSSYGDYLVNPKGREITLGKTNEDNMGRRVCNPSTSDTVNFIKK